ncbi:hypothetical protein A9513_016345 [Pseudomonas sp. AU12215]|nr:hypothetical protein A9513_016345 [Pseudomonas sp. AU12215]
MDSATAALDGDALLLDDQLIAINIGFDTVDNVPVFARYNHLRLGAGKEDDVDCAYHEQLSNLLNRALLLHITIGGFPFVFFVCGAHKRSGHRFKYL